MRTTQKQTATTGNAMQPYIAAAATTALSMAGLLTIYLTMPDMASKQTNKIAASHSASMPKDAMMALSLAAKFDAKGYTLANVRSGKTAVPILRVSQLPKDIINVRDTKVKKSVFFRTLLPMVLQVNAEISADRKRLLKLRNEMDHNKTLSRRNARWLDALAETYKAKSDNLSELIKRVDTVPVSLVLAQAAEESGWGTSRFAREGNALFGQWTWNQSHKGIVPAGRAEGKTHRIRAFDTAKDAIEAYTLNLNTHRAYARLRTKRATGASGYALTNTLDKYSERGIKYVAGLKSIMNHNNLQPLDNAKLSDTLTIALR